MKLPTRLRKMKLNSVDFVRRGANPAADIALYKSADHVEDMNDMDDIAKAEQDLTLFTEVLGESFSSIMKDDTLDQDEKLGMIAKSVSEFTDTLDDYITSSFDIGKSYDPQYFIRKGDANNMTNLEEIMANVNKSLLTPNELSTLEALIAKATETEEEPATEGKAGKVNPAANQEEAEKSNGELPPEVKKALEEVEDLKKSLEMQALEEVAKKYEVLGKKAKDEAQTLYNLKKSGDSNYNAYIAALDTQVEMIEKSGLFAEIGKSGSYNYTSLAKSEPETKVESIAKKYMESDPTLDYSTAVAKAWEDNPDLMSAYEQESGF